MSSFKTRRGIWYPFPLFPPTTERSTNFQFQWVVVAIDLTVQLTSRCATKESTKFRVSFLCLSQIETVHFRSLCMHICFKKIQKHGLWIDLKTDSVKIHQGRYFIKQLATFYLFATLRFLGLCPGDLVQSECNGGCRAACHEYCPQVCTERCACPSGTVRKYGPYSTKCISQVLAVNLRLLLYVIATSMVIWWCLATLQLKEHAKMHVQKKKTFEKGDLFQIL